MASPRDDYPPKEPLRPANAGSTPNPDPTILTTAALAREIANLKELFQTGHNDLREALQKQADANMSIVGTRLAGMDKAIELLQQQTNQAPDFVRDQVGQLRDLHGERFSSIDTGLEERDKRTAQSFDSINTQFQERDKRTEQLSLADKTAIAAALQAQKEAAGATNESNSVALAKMETNFTKLIEQGSTLVQSVSKNLDDKISDLKGRLDRGEGKVSVSDPELASKLTMLMDRVNSLGMSRDQHVGSEKATDVSMAKFVSFVAIAVAFAVGIGQIFIRLGH